MTSNSYVLQFEEPCSLSHALVGGKGANLGALAEAGFPVPPGFTVTTAAFAALLDSDGVGDTIAGLVDGLDYDDPIELERVTARIRSVIESAALPTSLTAPILDAYAKLGENSFVAVRSSGTAEDLADASFAGMHDTYLDIAGEQALLDAVKACWASLWTARATSYRMARGFDHTHGIAVVIQTMVPSEVAGVMFTANPRSAATDEIVINASWGLGEAIVSGISTPDEYILHHGKLHVKRKVLGAKEKRVVRNPDSGVGTVVEDVPAADRMRFSLTDAEASGLALLGRRVQEHYCDFPQDIEWGYADGKFYLLQSRPVTGVELSWDADVDDWQWQPEPPDDTVYTRNFADEVWTGAISPLFYSLRAPLFTFANEAEQRIWGQPEQSNKRLFVYHRGTAYYNCDVDRVTAQEQVFPAFRPAVLANVPPAWRESILNSPWSITKYLKLLARLNLLDRYSRTFGWIEANNDYVVRGVERANGVPDEVLQNYSDKEVKLVLDDFLRLECEYGRDVLHGMWIYARDSVGLAALMFAKWYTGGEVTNFADLITGTPVPTMTMVENTALWRLSEKIRGSADLSKAFEEFEDGAFFEACEHFEDGRQFLAAYREFMFEHGHRGHADRDIWYSRRSEDPAVDYRSFRVLLSVPEPSDPADKEREVEERRVRSVEAVAENLRTQPFGALKAQAFRLTMDYVMKTLMFRDDQRHWIDRTTFSMKRACKVLGGRLYERGLIEDPEDHYFLTRLELYSLLDGTANKPLLKAKIAGRAQNFHKTLNKQIHHPKYLVSRHNADDQYERTAGADLPEGMFQGLGNSSGTVEGVARVVGDLAHIGRVAPGEILVTTSTDPGWTPVFLLISGIVLETGGLLAHGSCLAREYGMPALQLADAMQHIPDGALIRINGDTGVVQVLGAQASPATEENYPEAAASQR